MGERIVLALLSGICLVIGLLAPAVVPAAQQLRDAEYAFLNVEPAPTPTRLPTLSLPRPTAPQATPPPTLTTPTQPSRAPAVPTSGAIPDAHVAQTFVIKLEGGGDMTVVATDYQSALNNVRSSGNTPIDEQP